VKFIQATINEQQQIGNRRYEL